MKKFTKMLTVIIAATAITISAGTKSVSASVGSTSSDSEFLHEIGICSDSSGWTDTIFHWGNVSNKVDKAWAGVGVTSVTNFAGENSYYINGREVTRREAVEYAAEKLGKNVDMNKYCKEPSSKGAHLISVVK